MLSVVILNVIVLSVVMLSVVAPIQAGNAWHVQTLWLIRPLGQWLLKKVVQHWWQVPETSWQPEEPLCHCASVGTAVPARRKRRRGRRRGRRCSRPGRFQHWRWWRWGQNVRKLFFIVTQVQRMEVKNVCSDNIFQASPEAVFLVMCDPSMNELLVN